MVQTWWQKLNANERMAATGAVVVFILTLLGGSWLPLIGSAVVLATYWLKYSPNQSFTWPAPIELINVVISGIIGIFALMSLLVVLGIGSFGFGALGLYGGIFSGMVLVAVAGVIAFGVGAGMMFLGTWREYQAMPKSAAPSTPTAPPPPASSTEPPVAPPSAPTDSSTGA